MPIPKNIDHALGMDAAITRRDFLGSTLLASGAEVLRSAPFGRISFANTDLAGAMDHRYSILEAHRAVTQPLDQVLT